ncbi:LLM class flavin-dependent oxidoreductase [Streptomyces javensis]|uniref:LLM class flavin-dependent oxidoreductase n=1 Tax=Streptomyces javensis TaxID=114698 RepID=UPI003406B298
MLALVRVIIGLGVSNPKIIEGWHGVPFTRLVGRTRETMEIVRAALRREAVDYSGHSFEIPLPAGQGTGAGEALKMMTKPVRSSVPLYIAALGPKSVEGAAAYADGWLPFLCSPEGAARVWGDALATGTAERSGDLAPLEVVAGGIVAIGEDVKGVLDLARPTLALYIGGMGARGKNFFNDLVRAYGYEAEARGIQDLYLDGKKKEAEAEVPLQLLEQVNLVGPASYVKERIEAFRESGVTSPRKPSVTAQRMASTSRLRRSVSSSRRRCDGIRTLSWIFHGFMPATRSACKAGDLDVRRQQADDACGHGAARTRGHGEQMLLHRSRLPRWWRRVAQSSLIASLILAVVASRCSP